MSVQTTADDLSDNLEEKLKELNALVIECDTLAAEVIDPETWGGDSWRPEYKMEIISLRELLHAFGIKLLYQYIAK